MDMRINQLTGQMPIENQTQAPKGDDTFKFSRAYGYQRYETISFSGKRIYE